MDGWIRIWFYETIDQADPPDDDRFIEIEPIYEFEIAEEDADRECCSMLMCIQRKDTEDPDQRLWYAQVSVLAVCVTHQTLLCYSNARKFAAVKNVIPCI